MFIARETTFVILILLYFSGDVLSLTCYSCSECDDPFEIEDVEQVTSNSSDSFCIKSRDTFDHVTRNVTDKCKETYQYDGFFSLGPAVYCCESDLCNHADRHSLGLILLVGFFWRWIFIRI